MTLGSLLSRRILPCEARDESFGPCPGRPASCSFVQSKARRSIKRGKGKVKQSEAKCTVSERTVGSLAESPTRSRLSQITSCHLASAGLDMREGTHVLTSCRPNPSKPVKPRYSPLRLFGADTEARISRGDLFPGGTSSSRLSRQTEITTLVITSFGKYTRAA